MALRGSELELLVDDLINEANRLFSPIIRETTSADQRSRNQRQRWTERHRLNVLLEAAQEAKEQIPKAFGAPWFLAELKATVELVQRWHNRPVWKEIEPSLVNATHFTHTIAKLHIAEHLIEEGHKVEIIPVGEVASPDLRVRAIGGTEDWATIECYQPKILAGGLTVERRQIEKGTKQAMKKAKRQLKEDFPGILAVCGFNQPRPTVENLKQTIAHRLQKSERSNLCGVLIMMLGILYQRGQETTSFTPTKYIDFVPNPNYFGRVDIVVYTPKDDRKLIGRPLEDIRTGDIFLQKIGEVSETCIRSEPVASTTTSSVTEQRLELVGEPLPKGRVIIFSQNNTLPLFKADGNVSFLCGNCGAKLVERVWKFSLSNMILKCPSCQLFSEVVKLELPRHSITGRIAVEKGDYNFAGTVVLKRGISFFGI